MSDMSAYDDGSDTSLTAMQVLIRETSATLDVARSEKLALEAFLETYHRFAEERVGKIATEFGRFTKVGRFKDYDKFFPDIAAEAKQRFQPHIDMVNAEIADLVKTCDSHIRVLQRNAYSSSLVHRLPFEVLGRIFTTAVWASEIDSWVPLNLSAVNKSWREAALRTPTVWSRIPLQIQRNDSTRTAHDEGISSIVSARSWIERSGITPLHLCVEWRDVFHYHYTEEIRDDWVALLLPLMQRIVSLEMKCHFGQPSPKQFQRLFGQAFGLLEELKFYGEHIGQIPDTTMCGLKRLRDVEVIGPFPPKTLEGLQVLESLTLKKINGYLTPVLQFWTTENTRRSLRFLTIETRYGALAQAQLIELPSLESLTILSLPVCADILDILVMPALAELHISNRRTWDDGTESGKTTVAVFLAKARIPTLRIFSLERVKGVDDHLKMFLQSHPELRSLRLSFVPCAKTMTALVKYSRQKPMCPRLEQLEIYGIDEKRSGRLDGILESRYKQAISEGEEFSEKARKFVRLTSLRWNGRDRLPSETEDTSELTASEDDSGEEET